MADLNSKQNKLLADCLSEIGNLYYYAVRFFAYFFFYYFKEFTAEYDKGTAKA